MKNIEWIILYVGSTLIDESLAYEKNGACGRGGKGVYKT